MGVVNTLSSTITNRDAVPSVVNNSRINGSPVQHRRAVMAIASGDSATSVYRLFSLPSNALPVSLRVSSPDIGTTTVGDFGLYHTTKNGSAVVDVDFFKASVSLKDGALAKSEIVNGNVVTLANSEKMIWELLALSADSQREYDVCLTLSGAADAAGTILVECDYTV